MEKSFTLGQVISAGAVGLLSGILIAHASSKSHKNKSTSKTTSGNNKPKQSDKKENTKPTAPNKSGQIEEDSEEYIQDEDSEDFTDEEEEEDDEEEDEGNDNLVEFDLREEYKMVLVIRSDLAMGKGKAAAQCCHATLANYKELSKKSPKSLTRWEYCGQAKVTLKVDSEDEMLLLQAQAKSLGLAANSIRDAGRTQIAAGSRTVLAVGPGPVSVVNSVTGKLKLY
ncbi:Peptidyl-tRNA hydrolase protein 2, mitochondrial [Entomortierella beljakovae]|nr:Peptidyl-tRNA hydrolase protein 2, mitochondrial [Entomortierella beljakovae]